MDIETVLGVYLWSKMMLKKSKKRKKRSIWCHNWLEKRLGFSHVHLLRELRDNDPENFRNYLRMDTEAYESLLYLVTPLIQKKNTVMRQAISPHERLSATLRFLATGRHYNDLKFSCAISAPSLSYIIPETCFAIYQVLKGEYLKFPSTQQEWLNIAAQFESRWQFPYCLGSIDGKHVQTKPATDSGSLNANYEFIMCDVGTNGRVSDGGVIENTEFHSRLTKGTLNLPTISENEGERHGLNYVFVADEAFALRSDLMKPYSQRELTDSRRIYNYRLSRARRIVENAFGILVSRFRIFESPIDLDLNNVDIIVLACCVLHNFLRRQCGAAYIPPEALDQDVANRQMNIGYRTNDQNMINLQRGRNINVPREAKEVREKFREYFNGIGAASCPWQWDMVNVAGYDGEVSADVNDVLQQRLEEEEIDDVDAMDVD